jgi:hypothetical protein
MEVAVATDELYRIFNSHEPILVKPVAVTGTVAVTATVLTVPRVDTGASTALRLMLKPKMSMARKKLKMDFI